MLKITAFVGSCRNNKSYCQYATINLVKQLKKMLQCDVQLSLFNGCNTKIEYCEGCCRCFLSGQCVKNDDLELIKEKLIESDIVIFSSPVYYQSVSGLMKSFLDRIAYMTHILALTGKIGISITVGDNNGVEEVSKYLDESLNFLGTSVIQNIKIYSKDLTEDALDSIIYFSSKKISKIILKNEYPITDLQEKFFQNTKMLMYTRKMDYEKKYWEEHNYFKYDTFKELYLANRLSNK